VSADRHPRSRCRPAEWARVVSTRHFRRGAEPGLDTQALGVQEEGAGGVHTNGARSRRQKMYLFPFFAPHKFSPNPQCRSGASPVNRSYGGRRTLGVPQTHVGAGDWCYHIVYRTSFIDISRPPAPPPGRYESGLYAPGRYAPGRYAPGRYAPGRYAPGRYDPGAMTDTQQAHPRARMSLWLEHR